MEDEDWVEQGLRVTVWPVLEGGVVCGRGCVWGGGGGLIKVS